VLTGWGRAGPSAASLRRVTSPEEVGQVIAEVVDAGGHVIARGLGRAYGDAAQCGGGTVIDCTLLDRIELDVSSGVVRAGAGVSVAGLLAACLPHGWCLDVMPGTAQVTMGGAVAADVHGKNHHVDGTFSRAVRSLEVVGVEGRTRVGPGPGDSPGRYWATVGGMGLTGVITEVTLQLRRVETTFVEVETDRSTDLDGCMTLLLEHQGRHRHSVAWVDGLAKGRSFGRSVVTGADHARREVLGPRQRTDPLAYRPGGRVNVGFEVPGGVIRSGLVAAANALWHAKAPQHREGQIQSLTSFFHPLDAVRGWNRCYGPSGFTQYQLVTPFTHPMVVGRALELLQKNNLVPSLVVLKTFGEEGEGPMSFPRSGWTLAVDLPLGSDRIGPTLDELDELVASAGGRVYLAKDGRLRPDLLRTMYPRLFEWMSARAVADPSGVFCSDLWARLSPSRPRPASLTTPPPWQRWPPKVGPHPPR